MLKAVVDVYVQVERAERTSRRRHRDLMAQERAYAQHDKFLNQQAALADKQREQEDAQYEVEEFEIRIEELRSVHHECVSPLDWRQIAVAPPSRVPAPQLPAPPVQMLSQGSYAAEAEQRLATYTPGLIDKVLGRGARIRQELEAAVENGRAMDWQAHQTAEQQYAHTYALWSHNTAQVQAAWQHQQALETSRGQQLVALARSVLSGDPRAYTVVLQQSQCLAELDEKGCAPEGNWLGAGAAEVLLYVNESTDLIPTERKALTQGRKLSVKKMPARESMELYQDFVCGVAIRAARELTAVLPLRGVVANVVSQVLNRATGHMEPAFILSAYFPREALVGRDFTGVDASDFVETLNHSMKLKKGVGMDAVHPLDAESLLAPGERVTPW